MNKLILLFICSFLITLTLFAQTNKITEVVVVGTGETSDAALQNALKKAIDQTFGSFITTKTEIINEELTKNELISVSNGNIRNYEVLSIAKLNNREFSTTVKATVSISNLVSFVKSKGISAELKGSLLSANILQQEFNESNELKATNELINVLTSILSKSFDYSLDIDQPTKGSGDMWNIPITSKVIPNENIKLFKQFLLKTMAGLSMKSEEINNYRILEKPVFKLAIGDEQSFEGSGASKDLFLVSNRTTLTKNNLPKIEINKSELKRITELKDKIFYIYYSAIRNNESTGLDTLVATSTNLKADVNKIQDLLFKEAEKKLSGGSFWYYTQDMMTFTPIVLWTIPDFLPPVFYFRNKESIEKLQIFFKETFKKILLDVKIKNEIKSIEGIELYKKYQDPRYGRNYLNFPENNFKLSFDFIYYKSNIPIRAKFFEDPNELLWRYSNNVSFHFNLDEYWRFDNKFAAAKKSNNSFGTVVSNSRLLENFEFIPYPFIDFLKFMDLTNPNRITKNLTRSSKFNQSKNTENKYVLVITLDSFKETTTLFTFKFTDIVTKEQLSKISNYTIIHN